MADSRAGGARSGAGWGWAMVFLATGMAYFPAVHAGFIWDDDAHVTKAGLRSLRGLGRIWFELGATQQYYPVLHSAFWLEHRWWGDAALGYHLINLLLHATAAGLFATVLRRLAIPGAWLAALIFALHPVGVESVAWISEQKNTLSTVFYLLAALGYFRFRARAGDGRTTAYLLATGLFLLALLSKTVTATLPAALLVVLWWRRGRLSWKEDILPLVPWLGLGAAAGLFSAWVERAYIGARGAAFSLDLAQRFLVAGRALWFYLGKLLWPADLIFIYPRWRIEASAGWQWLPPLGAAALLAAFWLIRRKTRAPLAALLFFAGTLFPALGFFNVYPFVFSYVADHFQYLASLGIIALAAAGWERIPAFFPVAKRPEKKPRRSSRSTSEDGPAEPGFRFAVKPIAAGALLCLLGALTWRQCLFYRDAPTLYRATLERNPASWLAHLNLGNILWEGGDADGAIAHYEESLRFNPDYPDTHFDLGRVLMEKGRPAEAAVQFADVLRINPGDAEAHDNLGIELANLGRMPEAAAQLEEALRLRPDNAKAHHNLGVVLRALGREAEAEAQFQRAAQWGGGR